MITKIDLLLQQLSTFTLLLVSICTICVIGISEYAFAHSMNVSLLYLAPIALTTWYCSRNVGIATVCCATVAWALGAGITFASSLPLTSTISNILSQFFMFLAISLLINALKRHLHTMGDLARLDQLTNLANRRIFNQTAATEAQRCLRYGTIFTIASIDIDDFKLVNDRFGHSHGDALLQYTANMLRANTRATDTVGRIGGDEFMILLPETDEVQARQTIDKIRAQLKEVGNRTQPITFSISVVTFVNAPVSVDEMLNCVDDVMYALKRTGKDSVSYTRWPLRQTLTTPLTP